MHGISIATTDKGASGYEDASTSQEREMRSGWPTRKLRAELKEAEQARKDEFAKEGKDMEARGKEAEVKEAKNRGAGGATGEAEEERGRRSNSTEENGDHAREESDEEITGESGIHPRKEGRSQNRSGHLNKRWNER